MSAANLSDGTCTLPGGLVLGDGRRFGHAQLRPLTGREEEWVAQHANTPSAHLATGLLSACFVKLNDAPVDLSIVRSMLVGDRDFLILQLRRMTFGERFAAVFTCPYCGANMDVEFLADEILVEPRPQASATFTLQLATESRPERAVRFRLPNGLDQEAIADLMIEDAVDVLFERCLVDDGGSPLTQSERAAVIDEMERLAPAIDLELDLICPECSNSFSTPFDCTAYFLSEVRSQSRHLMREVHYLALYYHWSEADILGLRRDRRREYLALLNETLRPN